MIAIFFVYGLAFFVLGLAIIVYPKKASAFKLAKDMWLIAGFGIFHGINEWLDMFILIYGPTPPMLLEFIRMIVLPCSFMFLLWFGIEVIVSGRKRFRLCEAVPIILLIAWAIILIFSKQRLLIGDITARYLLCLPGAFLTALGLLQQIPQFEQTKLRGVVRSLRLAAVAFLLYAILAGLIVKKSSFFPANLLNYDMFKSVFGFPIQIPRAVCAVVAACSTIYLLKVFHWETQQAIRRSQLHCNMIAFSCPIILYGQDRNLVFTFALGKGLALLGLRPDEIIGRHISQVFPSVPQLLEDSKRALGGEEFTRTVTINDVIFESCYAPVRDGDGEISSIIGVALDVTAKVQAQEELDKYRRELEKNVRLAEVGTMGAIMAQEIDEPLTVTRLLAQRLLREAHETSQTDVITDGLGKVLSEVSKVRDIVEKFRGIAQVGQRTSAEPADVYEIIKRLMKVFAQSAQRLNLEIAVKNIDTAPYMSITAHELEQVFFALFQNAIDNANSSVGQKLTISCKVVDKKVELQFEDSCGGVEPETLPHIFRPFSIARPYWNEASLGMAVAKQIVCARGGDIKVENKPGKGTVFHVILPTE